MWKKVLATTVVVALIFVSVYVLFAFGGGNSRGVEGGLRSPSIRIFVTLLVVGGSAFITGFGLRDVIGRALGARQRSRLKQAQRPVKH